MLSTKDPRVPHPFALFVVRLTRRTEMVRDNRKYALPPNSLAIGTKVPSSKSQVVRFSGIFNSCSPFSLMWVRGSPLRSNPLVQQYITVLRKNSWFALRKTNIHLVTTLCLTGLLLLERWPNKFLSVLDRNFSHFLKCQFAFF